MRRSFPVEDLARDGRLWAAEQLTGAEIYALSAGAQGSRSAERDRSRALQRAFFP